MDALTLFGLSAVTAMLICYALEDRSRTFILAFAASCVLGSAYGFLQGAWPFGLLEAIWSAGRLAAMAEAARGTCLTRANQVSGDWRIGSNARVARQCRDLKFFVLGRLQYFPVNFYEVNRVASFWTSGTEKDGDGLALAIMRS